MQVCDRAVRLRPFRRRRSDSGVSMYERINVWYAHLPQVAHDHHWTLPRVTFREPCDDCFSILLAGLIRVQSLASDSPISEGAGKSFTDAMLRFCSTADAFTSTGGDVFCNNEALRHNKD